MRIAPTVALLLWGLAASARAEPARWQWRADAGGQIDPSSHAVIDLGLRHGDWSLDFYTDTLEARYAPETATGKWWLAARGEALVAGLLTSPWTAGAPDPSRSLYASYGGVDAGWIRYLPASLYAGVHASLREYFFEGRSSTRITVPDARPLGTVETLVGRYTSGAHAWLRAGLDAEPGTLSPHIAGEAVLHPDADLAPRLELRAAWASHQDLLTRTRVGGLTPYAVPVGGAGWAEWWVESFVAARIGLEWRTTHTLLGAMLDTALFDSELHTGLALVGELHFGRLFAEAALGYAPWIARQEGVARECLWLRAGWTWSR